MAAIKIYLKVLCKEKIDEKSRGKLSLALKSYLARCCCSARNPEIIQINHYVDEYYAADKPKYKNIVLSPSRVSFPIAAFTNTSLVSKDACKLFFINKKELIEIHPYEYIIPVFAALFSGDNADLCGSSFIGSVILCGEMAMKLVEAEKLPIFKSTCVAMVIVIGHLWNLSSSSIAFVVDKILLESHDFSMQRCLQEISVANCSPNWFVDHYVVSDSTGDILSFLDHSMAEQNRASFPGLECLQFCVLGMGPVGSLLARVLYSHGVRGADRVTITIPATAWDVTKQQNTQQYSIGELESHLSALIIWKESLDSSRQRDETLLRHSIIENKSDQVSISLDEFSESVIGLNVNGERVNVSLSQSALMEIPLHRVLVPQIIWDLQVVLGSCASSRILSGIDSLAAQPSLMAALSFVFQRPALD